MEYYSAIKCNEIWILATTWVNLKKYYTMQKKPDMKGHILQESNIYPEQANPWRQKSGCQQVGRVTANGYKVLLGGDKNVL